MSHRRQRDGDKNERVCYLVLVYCSVPTNTERTAVGTVCGLLFGGQAHDYVPALAFSRLDTPHSICSPVSVPDRRLDTLLHLLGHEHLKKRRQARISLQSRRYKHIHGATRGKDAHTQERGNARVLEGERERTRRPESPRISESGTEILALYETLPPTVTSSRYKTSPQADFTK